MALSVVALMATVQKRYTVSSAVVFTDTNARATGDYCGTDTVPQAFDLSNVITNAGATATIRSVKIVDYTTTAAVALELWLFDRTFTAPADNAAWTVTDADALNCVGVIPIATTGWYASAANKVFTDNTANLPVTLSPPTITEGIQTTAGGTSLFYAIVARGATPAWTTAAGLKLFLGIEPN